MLQQPTRRATEATDGAHEWIGVITHQVFRDRLTKWMWRTRTLWERYLLDGDAVVQASWTHLVRVVLVGVIGSARAGEPDYWRTSFVGARGYEGT